MGLLSWRFLVDEGGHGVTTDLMSHSVDLAHMLVGPIARVVGTTETFIRQRPLPVPGRGTHYGRGAAWRPRRRRDERGLRRDALRVRERRARHVRGRPDAARAGEPDGLRPSRDRGCDRLEPRAHERAPALPRHRRAALRLHDGLRRRALPLPRQLRARERERHRLRGPRGDRGLRVLPLRGGAPAAPARVRGRARRGERAGRAAALGGERSVGRTSCRCGRTDGGPRNRRDRRGPDWLHARSPPLGTGARRPRDRGERRAAGGRPRARRGARCAGGRQRGGPARRAGSRRRGDLLEHRDARAADRRRRRCRQGDLLREARVARPRGGGPRARGGRAGRRAVPDRLQPPLRPGPPVRSRRGGERRGWRAAPPADHEPGSVSAAAELRPRRPAASSST